MYKFVGTRLASMSAALPVKFRVSVDELAWASESTDVVRAHMYAPRSSMNTWRTPLAFRKAEICVTACCLSVAVLTSKLPPSWLYICTGAMPDQNRHVYSLKLLTLSWTLMAWLSLGQRASKLG